MVTAAAIPPLPGVRLLARGWFVTGFSLLFVFCYGVIGLLCAVWWTIGPARKPPATLSTDPLPTMRWSPNPLHYFPGMTKADASLVVSVAPEKISVDQIVPIVPNSSRIVTRLFLYDLALCLMAVVSSLLVSHVLSRKPASASPPDEDLILSGTAD